MIKIILRQCYRSLLRGKLATVTNILCLSCALTFGILSLNFILNEFEFDRFNIEAKRLFRIDLVGLGQNSIANKGFLSSLNKSDLNRIVLIPPDLAVDLQSHLPEIKNYCRIINSRKYLIQSNGQSLFQDQVLIVDSSFMKLFSYKVLEGNLRNSLTNPNSIVFTKSTARKFFGKRESALNQIVSIYLNNSWKQLIVTAVVEDCPSTSSFQFSSLLPFHLLYSANNFPNKNLDFLFTLGIVEINTKVDPQSLKAKLVNFTKDYYRSEIKRKSLEENKFTIEITPLVNTHLDSVSFGWPNHGNRTSIIILIFINALILLVSLSNYAFIETTRVASKTYEIGIRKSFGANSLNIFVQFWIESFLILVLSISVAMIIALIISDNVLKSLGLSQHQFLWSPYFFIAIVSGITIISLINCLYPTYMAIRHRPGAIMGFNKTAKIRPSFARAITGLQFGISFIFIIAVTVMYSQLEYVENSRLGFNSKNVLVVDLFENNSASDPQKLLELMKVDLSEKDGIESISCGYNIIDPGISSITLREGAVISAFEFLGDFNYPSFFDWQLINGRFQSDLSVNDSIKNQSVVINQKLASALKEDYDLGYQCKALGNAVIIGVVKDFNFQSLTQSIEPAYFKVGKSGFTNIFIKVRPNSEQKALNATAEFWKRHEDKPLQSYWLEDAISNMYNSQKDWMKTIQSSLIVAIFISCLGLFGLSSINYYNRQKELSIRKVFGAGFLNLLSFVQSGLIKITIISFLLACPLAWYFAKSWLDDFAFKINLNIWLFVIPLLIGIVITFSVTIFHFIKAINFPPIKGLRDE